ncbi:MAG: hypothetical protein MUF81_14215 [Verrucomicrobia bacterium]|nr:hypothetical protein [Verrucomicrobiota bacterium]
MLNPSTIRAIPKTEVFGQKVSTGGRAESKFHQRHPVTTDCLELRLLAPAANAPAALSEVR